MKVFLSSAVLAIGMIAASSASASIIMQDDFESYADQTAFQTAWPVQTAPGLELNNTVAHSGVQSAFSNGANGRRNWRSLPSAQTGSNANPLLAEFWMNVPAVNSNARQYSEIRSYAGDACNAGALEDLFAIGMSNAIVGASFFQARAAFSGVSPSTSGWINLTVSRTAGWHRFGIEFVSGNVVNFYVDGVLGGSITDTSGGVASLDCFLIGSGLTSNPATPQNAYYDDVKIEVTPEPASLVLLGLGAAALLRRR